MCADSDLVLSRAMHDRAVRCGRLVGGQGHLTLCRRRSQSTMTAAGGGRMGLLLCGRRRFSGALMRKQQKHSYSDQGMGLSAEASHGWAVVLR